MSAVPVRIQLRRTKGWRKPDAAVVVARPSRWGNPFRVGIDGDAPSCIDRYREALWTGGLSFTVGDVRRQLAGRDLACWCRAEDPCHADVLLEVANGQQGADASKSRTGRRRDHALSVPW